MQGGMVNLAAELDVSLPEAAGLVREVQACLSKRSHGDGGDGDGGTPRRQETDDSDIIHAPTIMTANDLLVLSEYQHQRRGSDCGRCGNRHIVTFCRSIDTLLGGGIALGQVTEIAGLPGTGKTQLAMQLCVLARLPQIYGGVQGRALYVDAEGSFVPERAWTMAKALRDHVEAAAARRNRKSRSHNIDTGSSSTNVDRSQASPAASSLGFTTEEILNSIQVFRVHDETALMATLYTVSHYIQEQQQRMKKDDSEKSGPQDSSSLPVKLIIVDSIAFHFRAVAPSDSGYYFQRTKTLVNLAAFLGDLASEYNLAIVVINQMTTKVGDGGRGGKSSPSSSFSTKIVPALGESWAHATATRILLSNNGMNGGEGFGAPTKEDEEADDDSDHEHDNNGKERGYETWQQQNRSCTLVKSSDRASGTAHFRILEVGIRDVPPLAERNGRTASACSDPINKRHRTH